jgi:indoleamine 2,3-dioxygenase
MFSKLVTKRYTQNIAFRSFSKVDSRGTPSIFSDIDKHGFLPSQKPMITLPSEFKALNEALDAMRFLQNGQETGLLAKNELRKQIDANFPNLIEAIKKSDPNDARLQGALFRDYSFLSSGYMLEPCHINYLKTKNYGRGSDHIPETLAVPMKFLCDRIGYGQPLLEYAYGYSLNNWMLINDKNPTELNYKNEDLMPNRKKPIENLKCIRQHIGNRDEEGFILIHVVIVSRSHLQIAANKLILEGAKNKDRATFNKGMQQLVDYLVDIQEIFNLMWKESLPKSYLTFRTFIMGVQGNDEIFPNKMLYKGCFDNVPQAFRGETGAQDSIIPATDSVLGLDYPKNQLT